MLDVAPTELLLVAVVAIVVIGPKDLPKAMRVAGHWVGRARGVARQFRQGFDDMVREAEFAEMEKKWAEENARIMREFPTTTMSATALPAPDGQVGLADDATTQDADDRPVMTAQPHLRDDTPPAGAASKDALADKGPDSSAATHGVAGQQVEHPIVEPSDAPIPARIDDAKAPS